jgi:hypothetical protein
MRAVNATCQYAFRRCFAGTGFHHGQLGCSLCHFGRSEIAR